MKQWLRACLFLLGSLFAISCTDVARPVKTNALSLWYDEPAEYFINALPIGNGRLAAMVYGNPSEEVVHLNEETLWSGGPVDLNPNPSAPDYLPQIRKALDENKYEEADKLVRNMQGYFSQSYAPVGDLLIRQKLDGKVENYRRELDLKEAVATTSFSVDGVQYRREMFVSYPDQLIYMRLTSSEPEKLSLSVSLRSLLHPVFLLEEGELVMDGRAPSHADPTYMNTSDQPVRWDDACKGMRCRTRVKAVENDGDCRVSGDSLLLTNASKVMLAVSIATSFNGFDKCPMSEGRDEKALAKNYLLSVQSAPYDEIKKRHIEDYQSYFNKVNLYLKGNEEAEKLPTDERLLRYQKQRDDYGLETLLFNYGRYLFISSSRKEGVAANLQGKWNVDLRPAWSCNYTVNINLEMNYWAADKMGLDELGMPLVNQIRNMSETGRYTARNFYNCRGWAAGHNSDIWAITNPVGHVGMGDPQWANWNMASPWLCQHLWDKYLYNGDEDYLREVAYPVMKGAAEFCQDWLVDDGHGRLLTSPSTSPENRYIGDDGKQWAVAKGATMDIALIRNLFENTIEACKVLHIDMDMAETLQASLAKMLPYQIGRKGNLQEWAQDYAEADSTHRHVSHLFALHPGHDISLWKTPELFNACKQTLRIRGDEGTGWSRAWKICFWARLLDGNHAHRLLQNALAFTDERGFSERGGTYTNLLNACPPFQIDGNFGVIEGICEMLLQSHLGEIHLLPALPQEWAEGSIQGIRARGGYNCSIQWSKSKLEKAEIVAERAGVCRVRTNCPIRIKGDKTIETQKIELPEGVTYVTTFHAEKKGRYVILPIEAN